MDIVHSYQSLRTLVVGGSAMPRALIQGYEAELGVNVIQAWGTAHPKVMEAAAIAVPDERRAEWPLAVVAPIEDGEDVTAEELKAFLTEQVAKFWIPDEIVFVEQLPKTSAGIFSKATLRKMVDQGDLPIAAR